MGNDDYLQQWTALVEECMCGEVKYNVIIFTLEIVAILNNQCLEKIQCLQVHVHHRVHQ